MTADEAQRTRTRITSVPNTSKFAVSVCGSLDQLVRSKPNKSTIACEAYIMFSSNKKMEWLQCQTKEQTAVLIKEANKGAKKAKQCFRIQEIEEAQKKTVAERMKKKK